MNLLTSSCCPWKSENKEHRITQKWVQRKHKHQDFPPKMPCKMYSWVYLPDVVFCAEIAYTPKTLHKYFKPKQASKTCLQYI